MDNDTWMEPKDYFTGLKDKVANVDLETLRKNKEFLEHELAKADILGQKNLKHKLAFAWETLQREMVLNSAGITKFVYRDDVVKMIDNVTPKNSVKIAELENFPRSIPEANMDEIVAAQQLEIFDRFIVVYTDFVDEEVLSQEQKDTVARNRDPVVFGMFIDDKLNVKHDRMYFITDWEDEFCDLTFTKMIERMAEIGIKNPSKHIDVTSDYVNRVIEDARLEVEETQKKNANITFTSTTDDVVKVPFWKRAFNLVSGK